MGDLPEIHHLDTLLKIKKSGVNIVFPIPLELNPVGIAMGIMLKLKSAPESANEFVKDKILKQLSEFGVQHNDVKADNIMLDENSNICLIDFGAMSIGQPFVDYLSASSTLTDSEAEKGMWDEQSVSSSITGDTC